MMMVEKMCKNKQYEKNEEVKKVKVQTVSLS